jgi:hypothetical protein
MVGLRPDLLGLDDLFFARYSAEISAFALAGACPTSSSGYWPVAKKKPHSVSEGGLCLVGRDRLELPTFCV